MHYEINQSTIQWTGMHIKGHQDKSTRYQLLDRTSQLNILVNHMAKQHLLETAHQSRQVEVNQFSWALKIDNKPLINDIDNTIYDRVHSPIAKKYWL
jgi:hypothetical protein